VDTGRTLTAWSTMKPMGTAADFRVDFWHYGCVLAAALAAICFAAKSLNWLRSIAGVPSRRGGKIIFAESKHFKKDRILPTPVGWLDPGLRSGLTCENYM